MGPHDRPGLWERTVGEVAGYGQEGGLCPRRAAILRMSHELGDKDPSWFQPEPSFS